MYKAPCTHHKTICHCCINLSSCAAVASACFEASPYASKIKLILDSAEEAMKKLLRDGEKFDIVFLDADKENYICYYEVRSMQLALLIGLVQTTCIHMKTN